MSETLRWRCHTPNLLEEVLCNQGAAQLKIPIQILGKLLADVADRAAKLNDPMMNALMCRLTLYSAADPKSPDYNPDALEAVFKQEEELRKGKQL